jgi:hypothetical protein
MRKIFSVGMLMSAKKATCFYNIKDALVVGNFIILPRQCTPILSIRRKIDKSIKEIIFGRDNDV